MYNKSRTSRLFNKSYKNTFVVKRQKQKQIVKILIAIVGEEHKKANRRINMYACAKYGIQCSS